MEGEPRFPTAEAVALAYLLMFTAGEPGVIPEGATDRDILALAFQQGLRLGRDEKGWWVRNWVSHEDTFPTAAEAARAYLDSIREPEATNADA